MLLISRDGRSTWRAAIGTLTMLQPLVERVDQRLVRVRVVREDVERHRGLARVSAEAGRDVDVRDAQQPLHDEVRGLVAVLVRRPSSAARRSCGCRSTMSASTREHRRDQLRDARLVVVIVGVRVDDDVGAARDRFVERRLKVAARPRLRRFEMT